MTMPKDEFRRFQRLDAGDPNGNNGKYGCSCCRKIYTLRLHKKMSRKLARSRLKQYDRKNLDL